MAIPLLVSLGAMLASSPGRAATPTIEPSEHSVATPSTRLALSTQLLEIVALGRSVRHQTALLSTGLSMAHIVSAKWTLIGGVNFATGLDSVSLGGSAVFSADRNLVRRGALRFGLGPDLAVVQSWFSKGPAGWGNVTVVSTGLGLNLGYKGATFMFGLAPGYAPQRGGSWSLTPRAGVSASF